MPLFRRRIKQLPPGPVTYGLVVPPKARLVLDPVTGAVVYDELRELERGDRMRGRKLITFEEDPDEVTGIGDINGIR